MDVVIGCVYEIPTNRKPALDRAEGFALALQRSSLAAPDVSSASTPFRRRTRASARH